MAGLIYDLSPKSDFYSLDCIKNQKPEFSIKLIEVIDILPSCSFYKLIQWLSGSISLLEWKHIGTHPVIAHIGKMPFGPCSVIDNQTSIFENLYLLIESLWRFIICPHSIIFFTNII